MMETKSVKEICRVLADQLSFEADDIFKKTGELHNEKQVIADMLHEIAEYEHTDEHDDEYDDGHDCGYEGH